MSRGVVKLISRKGIVYKAFGDLCSAIADATRCRSAILDGEIICCEEDGRPLFNDLLRRRKPARYVAFDLLWLNGVDWRERSLVLRRQELRAVIPSAMPRIWMAHTVVKRGKALFAEACREDLEGIVAKWMPAPYAVLNGRSPWVKIKNPRYSQAVGRHEWFETRG